MPDDRIAFAKPFRIEEPADFRIVGAKGRHTGILVFFSSYGTIADKVLQVPSEEQAGKWPRLSSRRSSDCVAAAL